MVDIIRPIAAAFFVGTLFMSASADARLIPKDVRQKYALTDTWYTKFRVVEGIPIVGSAAVSDDTMRRAVRVTRGMISGLPRNVRSRLRAAQLRVVIVGAGETVSRVPGLADRLGPDADIRYWGGVGATPGFPLCVATEANLLRGHGDENLLVYALATSVADIGFGRDNKSFAHDLARAYALARAQGLWANSYAASSAGTYWAEGVQSYFGVNRSGPRGGDGVHGNIDTRRELRQYDPRLYRLIEATFGSARL